MISDDLLDVYREQTSEELHRDLNDKVWNAEAAIGTLDEFPITPLSCESRARLKFLSRTNDYKIGCRTLVWAEIADHKHFPPPLVLFLG